MRISELSRTTGVPVATIKYYLREGLLPAGEATAATQAQYGEEHVQRLRLVRALADVGGLSIAAIREVVQAIDDENTDVHTLLGTAQYALGPTVDGEREGDPEWSAAREEVDALVADLEWQVTSIAPARDQLAHALMALHRVGLSVSTERLRAYAEAAQSLAVREVDWLRETATRTAAVERVVVGAVLYEPVLLALRRMAQENESAKRFGTSYPRSDGAS